MEKLDIVLGILENLGYAETACRGCPPSSVDEMVVAARELDAVISSLAGVPHLPAPDGEDGVTTAFFFFRSSKEKAQSFQFFEPDERVVSLLEGVLGSTVNIRAALPL